MKVISLKVNSILNAIRSLMAVLFPLITTPYITRVLGIDNCGRYSFSYTFVSYFVLIAALGINNYAIREGATLRENTEALEKFVSEVFSINIISTIISYVLLFACLFSVSKFNDYKEIILILSAQIILATIGVEWIYTIFEDYLYITIRSILFQIVSLVLLFTMVKTKGDTNIYACVTVISSVGASAWNLIKSRKYCKIKLTYNLNIKKHIKPILFIFVSNAAVMIYVNADNTILGFLTSDYNVGLYSLATKIYRALKTMLSALVVVSIPRLSYYYGNSLTSEFNKTLSRIFNLMMTFVFPLITGIVFLSKDIILFLSDESFLEANNSIIILGIATLFCMLSYIYGQCILMPLHHEKVTMYATIVSAMINIALNFLLIPTLKQDGAAITTVIAEGLVFAIYWVFIHKIVRINNSKITILKTIPGCIIIWLICYVVTRFAFGSFMKIVLCTVISAFVYFVFELIVKNQEVITIYSSLKRKLAGRKNT